MNDIHIEDFYRDAALILIVLYKHFPRKYLLFVEDISGVDTPDDFGLHTPRHLSCLQTMVWLADEGFLRFDDLVRQEAIEQAVLTQRAFLLLSSVSLPVGADPLPPNSVLISQYTRVQQLEHALKAQDSLLIRQLMRHLLADACNKTDILQDDLPVAIDQPASRLSFDTDTDTTS
jgi:hypothetical protein